ncbi:MAG: carbohydrate kinase family protein [Candidatus Levybacteria bacterium]|nr:carbohydrate kinase family protein [Candidatus Levybacteria bacterium]
MTVDVLTVGNALIDLLVTVADDNPYCRVDKESHELCIKAGEKILADHVGFVLGGGACRVAIALARLGFTTAVFAEIGNDELATRIQRTLAEEKVDTSHLGRIEKMTSFTVGLNFQKERTLFTHHVASPHVFDFSTTSCSWMYLASLGKPWQNVYEAVVLYKKEKGIKVACNPGPSQFVMGRESYLPTLSQVDVLFVNKQEAQIVAAKNTEDVKKLLQTIKMLGPTIVVITDGRKGSCAIDSTGKTFAVSIHEVPVVERTGAGDAYAAGFLAATMQGKDVREAMQWGTVNAAAVVQAFGGLSGLLTKEKLVTLLAGSDVPKAERL